MPIDYGRRSDDYARHRPGFPPSFYDRLQSFITVDGVRAVDVGTGPGIVALELAARGATVTGIDISENQVAVARRVATERGLADRCDFRVGPAESIDLPDASYDLITACQCWIWLDAPQVVAEARRLLRPGGTFVVAQFDYLSIPGGVAARTEDLILQYNPDWTLAGKNGLYPHEITDVTGGGIGLVEQLCYDHMQPFTHAAWRGRVRTCNGVGAGVLTDAQVGEFDRALAERLRAEFPEDPLVIPHRVWMVIGRRP